MTAQAELVDEQYRLVFDILDVAVRLAYHQRILSLSRDLALQCEAVRAKTEAPEAQGLIPRKEYVDICLRSAAAQAGRENIAARAASLAQEFRRLSGVAPERVDFRRIEANAFCNLNATNGISKEENSLLETAWKRPDVLAAYWHLRHCQSELDQSRARRYPWFSHLAGSYSWRNSTEAYDRSFLKQRDESSWSSQFSTSQQSTIRSEERWTNLGEYEAGASAEIKNETGQSTGTSVETEQVSGSERGGQDAAGDEWWVEFGIEIPIFEWFSKEVTTRGQVALDAQRMFDSTFARARDEMRIAHASLLASQAEHVVTMNKVNSEVGKLNALASVSRTQGLTGEIEATRINERSTELTQRLLEREMGKALIELDFCRAAGIIPGQTTIEDSSLSLGHVEQKRRAHATETALSAENSNNEQGTDTTTPADNVGIAAPLSRNGRPKVDHSLLDLMRNQQARWSGQLKEVDRRYSSGSVSPASTEHIPASLPNP